MPMSGNTYVAPTWVNNAPPALDATELQAICDAIVNNQGDVSSLQSALQSLTTTVNGKPNMQIVSYVGTGTYGVSNPCSITASFPIDVAFMLSDRTGTSPVENNTGSVCIMVSSYLSATSYSSGFGFSWAGTYPCYGKRSLDRKTFYWYNSSAANMQFNVSGNTYYVLCVGV